MCAAALGLAVLEAGGTIVDESVSTSLSGLSSSSSSSMSGIAVNTLTADQPGEHFASRPAKGHITATSSTAPPSCAPTKTKRSVYASALAAFTGSTINTRLRLQ